MKPELSVFVNQYDRFSEVFLVQLFTQLAKEKSIEVISLRGGQLVTSPGVSVRTIEQPFSFRFLFHLPALLIRLKKINLRIAYRLFVIESGRADKLYFPFISMVREFEPVIGLSGKKIFTSIRGTDITVTPVHQPEIVSVYKKIAQRIYANHFLSEELQQRTHEYGITFGREKIIYQGVDTEKFLFNGAPLTDKLRLITVGRLHYIKGLEFLLLACLYLERENIDFQLTIVGEGPERNKLIYLIHYLKLHNKVTLVGKKNHEELRALYREHNVYIHTHLVSGVSNTMLEALASNLRVVTFHSNLQCYTRSIVSALIAEVPVGDVQALKEELITIKRNNDFGNDQEKVNQALESFSVHTHVKGFMAFFEFDR